jgi:ABC-2 type transport system ATP-binding protein
MITVQNVSKYYGPRCAVSGLDFRIDDGECVGFLGLNGAGKSTTLRLLSCLLLPTSGRITIHNLDAAQEPHEIRKLIGYLPDSPPLYAEMTVREYLLFAARLRRMSRAAARQRLGPVLEICAIADHADQPIATLSHGYRQRVGIAQAIMHDPTLLILDEPIQGLDPVQIVEMRELIRSLRGKHTILLSTHILSEIEQTCDRILMMHEGRLHAEGTEEELTERYGTTSGGNIELEVRGEASVLQEALADIELHSAPTIRRHDGVLKVTLRAKSDVREAVGRAVVGAGLGLLGMTRTAGGLEEIFVKLTEEGAANALRPPTERSTGEGS